MLRPSRVRREVCSGHRLRLRDVQHYSLLLSIIKSRKSTRTEVLRVPILIYGMSSIAKWLSWYEYSTVLYEAEIAVFSEFWYAAPMLSSHTGESVSNQTRYAASTMEGLFYYEYCTYHMPRSVPCGN